MPKRKRGQNRNKKGRTSAHKKATKPKAWRPILKWIRTAVVIAASISTYNITILNVESWRAPQLTQETHFSFDSKTTIKVGGDK